jgi:hypothetical protein
MKSLSAFPCDARVSRLYGRVHHLHRPRHARDGGAPDAGRAAPEREPARPLPLDVVIMDASVQARLSAIEARAKPVPERSTRKERDKPSLPHP